MTTNRGSSALAWPGNLSHGAVRWSFRSLHYDTTIAFYRDLVRLSVLAEFSSSFGEDGTILGLPDTSVHLEILRARPVDTGAVGHEEIVLYLDGDEAVHSATAGLRRAGMISDREGHPYWGANGAFTYRDPDGRALVFAPWVFGQVPDPVDRPTAGTDPAGTDPAGALDDSPRIDWYGGERHGLLALFEEAEDSAMQLEAYIGDGRVLVARVGDAIVGHLQLVEGPEPGDVELKSMAVAADRRGAGIGTRLVEHAITASRASGYRRMQVGTAAADIDNLRFYQRRGFRVSGVEQDVFNADAGYAEGITVGGIPLRDRVWFVQAL
jgi:GNAT superfamily N-acetyltransferase